MPILALFVCIYFIWRIANKWTTGLSFQFLLLVFIFHVTAGVGLTIVYTYYYPNRRLADTFRYFDDSYFLNELLYVSPKNYLGIMLGYDAEVRDGIPLIDGMYGWFLSQRSPLYNDNRTIIRINTLLRLVSFGSYYFHLISFVMMSFLGKIYLFRAFQEYFTEKKLLYALALFLIPSVVFWSSGIMKEGPLFLVFGLFCFYLLKIYQEGYSTLRLLVILLLLVILFHLKFYVGLMVLPIVSLHLLGKRLPTLAKWKLLCVNYGAYFGLAIIWHFIRWKWSLFTVFKWKKKDFEGLAESMDAGSYINTLPLEDNALSFLINIPVGLFNALFRPFIWEVNNAMMAFSAIENILILGLIIILWVFRKKDNCSKMSWYWLIYALTLLAIVGVVTPIAGSLVRYKIPALPFLLFFFIERLDLSKFSGESRIKKYIE